MVETSELSNIYQEIFLCRQCEGVVESLIPRKLILKAYNANVALMGQAPSERGVRMSGIHWVGTDGKLRRPGGTFLDKYLQSVGYSVDPEKKDLLRPYTTNVLHCWTGRSGARDRSPSKEELRNCKHWWVTELQVVRPRVLVLLGKPASEAFAMVCGNKSRFVDLLQSQGQTMNFGKLTFKRFVLPHPTAPYPGKSVLYGDVFGRISRLLRN
jgi:uracil-DNA glycosylase